VTARPKFLLVIAAFGILLGGYGVLNAIASGTSLLLPRDAYIKAHRDEAEKRFGETTPNLRDALVQMTEKQAAASYSRRGVALPLAAIDLILSFLMMAGCLRALRGMGWGASAWSLAAKLIIPFMILDTAFGMVRARDMAPIFAEAPQPIGGFAQMGLSLHTLWTFMKSTLVILYCGTCVLYLRRPRIKALFRSDPPAA
jgi:hypothetical protein